MNIDSGGPIQQYSTPYHAHNIYLHIAVEQGIPSLLIFLWMMAIIYRQIFSMRQTKDLWRMGTFVGASGFLISALVYGLADNILHQRTVLLFWFIIGIIFYAQRDRHSGNAGKEEVSCTNRALGVPKICPK